MISNASQILYLLGAFIVLITASKLSIIVAACTGLILFWTYKKSGEESCLFVLGLFVCILPIFGSQPLLFSALLLLFFSRACHPTSWLMCWPAVLLAWSLAYLISSSPLDLLNNLQHLNVLDQVNSLRHFMRVWLPWRSLLGVINIWVMLIFAFYFSTKPESVKRFISGLQIGVLIALLVLICQICQLIPFSTWPNYNPFWSEQARYAASFSDPNAFGIMAALLISLSLKRQAKYVLLCAALFFAALTSGSRSFLLAMVMLAGGSAIGAKHSKIKLITGAGMTLAIASLAFYIMRDWSSFQRMQNVFLSGQLSDFFFSRTAFTQITAQIFLQHPLIGVGPERYREFVVPVASSLGLNTGLWVDNSNNFYLGSLAQLGWLGCGLALLSINALKLKKRMDFNFRSSLLILLLLLLLGPHIEFSEIALVASCLIGSNFDFKNKSGSLINARMPMLCFVLVFSLATLELKFADVNFYDWEESSEGLLRWSAPQARFAVSCTANQAKIYLRAHNKQLAQDALKVELNYSGRKTDVLLTNSKWREESLVCAGQPEIVVGLKTSRPLLPSYELASPDGRILGVQLRVP